jgi:hypothetical protein
LTALTLMAACGYGSVKVEQFQPEPSTHETCDALFGLLPETLGNAVRRNVSVDPPLAAAWGDPPIVLRCGVNMPAAYEPAATLTAIDGVGWLPEEGEGGAFFTSADRAVLVEVAIPDDHSEDAQGILTELAGPILSAIPERPLS